MSNKCFIYARISQDREGAGLGTDRQIEDCTAMAQSLGMQVAEVFEDNDVSASSYTRKVRHGYLRMLARLDEVEAVLIWHADRLHRQPAELEHYVEVVRKHRVRTYAVKGGEIDLATPEGLLQAGILGQLARYESAHKSDRIKRKHEQSALQGRWRGGARPFGWDAVNGELHLNDLEADMVRDAIHGVLEGRSLGSIVREWNASGVPTTGKGNRPWTYATLRQLLMRPRNAGLSVLRGEVVPDVRLQAEPIVSDEIWRAVCAVLSDPNRRRSQTNKARHLLAGIAQCHCGMPTRSATVTNRKGEKSMVYRCPAKGPGHVGKKIQYVDAVVKLWVYRSLFFGLQATAESPETKQRAAEIRAELAVLGSRERELGKALADGVVTLTQVASFNSEVARKREKLETEQARLGMAHRPTIGAFRDFGVEVEQAREQFEDWLALPVDERRDYIRARFHVILHNHTEGSPRVFDPNTVAVHPRGHAEAPGPLGAELIPNLARTPLGDDPQAIFSAFVEQHGF